MTPTQDTTADHMPVLVRPDGRPARTPSDAKCPRCGAGPDQRVKTAGFGKPAECCQRCAFEFKE